MLSELMCEYKCSLLTFACTWKSKNGRHRIDLYFRISLSGGNAAPRQSAQIALAEFPTATATEMFVGTIPTVKGCHKLHDDQLPGKIIGPSAPVMSISGTRVTRPLST